MRFTFWIITVALLAAAAPAQEYGNWTLDLEAGAAFSGYNDVRIPGDTGTRFSLTEDLETDPAAYWRVRLSYTLGERHTLSVLAAPLRLEAEGTVDFPIDYEGVTFPAGAPLTANYRFDSYRLSYRYDFLIRENLVLGAGFTAKVRDAAIRLAAPGLGAEKTNTGFVPLIRFRLQWNWNPAWAFLLEGDALAAPQGRAEDVLAALAYDLSPRVSLKAGYRILEGGADNDEVYSFALVHYAAAGLLLRF